MFRITTSEFFKLKSTPIPYLLLGSCFFVSGIVLIASVLDVYNTCQLNTNPWEKYFNGALAIFSVFVITPLTILLIATATFIERRADAYKYLYTLPISRSAFYFAKLQCILMLVLLAIIFLFFLLLSTGYILDLFYPEYELRYYHPNILGWIESFTHLYIATFGIIGIQYFLSSYFEHFILPFSIGFIGFILGFLLAASNQKIALFFPYAYPCLAMDVKMFLFDHRASIWENSWLTNVEFNSLLCFTLFVVLGNLFETSKNIK